MIVESYNLTYVMNLGQPIRASWHIKPLEWGKLQMLAQRFQLDYNRRVLLILSCEKGKLTKKRKNTYKLFCFFFLLFILQ